ncbi:MAG: hypothetical protein H7249_17250 [Chitinophagaceae bacterium]|nr:hypothetical protein [Oligoflexus sp.]
MNTSWIISAFYSKRQFWNPYSKRKIASAEGKVLGANAAWLILEYHKKYSPYWGIVPVEFENLLVFSEDFGGLAEEAKA